MTKMTPTESRIVSLTIATIIINSILLLAVVINRASIEGFKNTGERFTYCDAVLLLDVLDKEASHKDEICVDDTRFTDFLREENLIR